MSKCENCIHYGACDKWWEVEEVKCNYFKDKSLFVELPCKVGTELFLSDYLNAHHRLKEYKFIGDKIAIVIDCWEWQRTCTRWLDDFGKTVFLTKEEAEKEIERNAKNN